MPDDAEVSIVQAFSNLVTTLRDAAQVAEAYAATGLQVDEALSAFREAHAQSQSSSLQAIEDWNQSLAEGVDHIAREREAARAPWQSLRDVANLRTQQLTDQITRIAANVVQGRLNATLEDSLEQLRVVSAAEDASIETAEHARSAAVNDFTDQVRGLASAVIATHTQITSGESAFDQLHQVTQRSSKAQDWRMAQRLNREAVRLCELGQVQDALPMLRSAVDLAPHEGRLLLNLAFAELMDAQPDQAQQHLERASACGENGVDMKYVQGLLALLRGQAEQALALFHACIDQAPQTATYLAAYARAAYLAERASEAEWAWQELLTRHHPELVDRLPYPFRTLADREA